MRTNILRLLALTSVLALGACAIAPTQTQNLLNQTQQECIAGNQSACAAVPNLISQEQEEADNRRAVAAMFLASHPVYTPTFAYQPPSQVHCSSVATGQIINTNCY